MSERGPRGNPTSNLLQVSQRCLYSDRPVRGSGKAAAEFPAYLRRLIESVSTFERECQATRCGKEHSRGPFWLEAKNDATRRKWACFNQAKTVGHQSLVEQEPAAAMNQRGNPDPVLIKESLVHQGP